MENNHEAFCLYIRNKRAFRHIKNILLHYLLSSIYYLCKK